MAKTKIRRCTDNACDGVMYLVDVNREIPSWRCFACGTKNGVASQYDAGVKLYHRDVPEDQLWDDVDTTLTFNVFCNQYKEYLE